MFERVKIKIKRCCNIVKYFSSCATNVYLNGIVLFRSIVYSHNQRGEKHNNWDLEIDNTNNKKSKIGFTLTIESENKAQ